MGHDYQAQLQKHASQTDAAKGFGGKYGVQKDRVDKSAVDWTYQEKLQQHASQTGLLRDFVKSGYYSSSFQEVLEILHTFYFQ